MEQWITKPKTDFFYSHEHFEGEAWDRLKGLRPGVEMNYAFEAIAKQWS